MLELGVLSPNYKHREGVLLVEAMSYTEELYGGGCGATGTSLIKIKAALQRTRRWLGVVDQVDWLGPLYPGANRLAHLYFLREILGVPTWFVNVCFTGDPRRPTARET